MVLRVYGDMTFLEMSLLPRVLCRLIRLFGSKLLLFFLKVGGSGVSGKTKKKKKKGIFHGKLVRYEYSQQFS